MSVFKNVANFVGEVALNRSDIESMVLNCIDVLNQSRLPEQQLKSGPESPVFGDGSPLDSMGLVSLIMDLEDAFSSAGHPLSLSDAKAMSRRNSPYRSVKTLVDFIMEQTPPS